MNLVHLFMLAKGVHKDVVIFLLDHSDKIDLTKGQEICIIQCSKSFVLKCMNHSNEIKLLSTYFFLNGAKSCLVVWT